MQNLIEQLIALHKLESESRDRSPNRPEQAAVLRAQIPESLLRTFDSFVAREKKPVSQVRRGVCSECHIQIAVGTLAALTFGHGLQQCGNCGRFLHLPVDEPVYAPVNAPRAKENKSGKPASAASGGRTR
jgi:predicted  nucleic acid-binding Zn-ribbon protein